MREIASHESDLGGDGAKLSGKIGVEESYLVAEVQAKYPIAKIIDPATKAVDGLLDKLKAAIPGTWDDTLIDKFKAEYKDDLVKLISE